MSDGLLFQCSVALLPSTTEIGEIGVVRSKKTQILLGLNTV